MALTAAYELRRHGLRLEDKTLSWNVVGIVGLIWAAVVVCSGALATFGLDSLIEMFHYESVS